MNITIQSDKCLFCGKKMDEAGRNKHHAIPKCLNPKFNITIPLHNKCHKIINKLYIAQEKKLPYDKLKNILKEAMDGLKVTYDKIDGEVEDDN